MTADISRLTSIDRPVIPAASSAAGAGPIEPSSALTRITSVNPHDALPAQPLGRSGLDVLDVLSVTDHVAPREATGAVAREVGLEHARGSLLRNVPGEALASLDSIWDGAQHSEEGWYLRSGALSALGLPGESERVAGDGLALRPSSMALRFMQSFARLTLGDFAGARSVLQPALEQAPREPLLIVQRALVQAKQGDQKSAEAQVQLLGVALPDHPVVNWGRAMLRSISADAARQHARPTPNLGTAAIPDVVDALPATDAATSALERFGERLATEPMPELVREARMLMRAFSAGGTLAMAIAPEHAHAARVVLATFLGVATGEGTEAPAPLRSLVQQLIPLLQHGRAADAERIIRRHIVLLREPMGRLLLALVRGSGWRDATTLPEHATDAPTIATIVVRGDADRGPLVPVRLGLGLLEETPASRAALDLSRATWNTPALPFGVREEGAVVRYMMSGAMQAVPDPAHSVEGSGEGWGAAAAAPRPDAAGSIGVSGARLSATALVALAVGAIATGHPFVAICLGVGSVWMALHRGDRDTGDRERTHEGSSSQ